VGRGGETTEVGGAGGAPEIIMEAFPGRLTDQDFSAPHVGAIGDVLTLSDGTSVTFAGFFQKLF
jgi:hypothetical protein